MRLASFNVENFFDRPKALNQKTWAKGKPILEAFAALNVILEKASYSRADKAKILQLLVKLGIKGSDDGIYARLRQDRGHLLKRSKTGPPEIIASGRPSWIGWVELITEAVDEIATRNTARVIRDVGADVQGVVEAENRTALVRLNNDLLGAITKNRYAHVMLIDGNDDRGIDVGILTAKDYPIVGISSHVDDTDPKGVIFSRDCTEYTIAAPQGERLLVMVNHLKSKGYGKKSDSNERRRRQARRIREIYEERRAAGQALIAIIGDFNDTPNSAPLAPLLSDGSDLRDISTHSKFKSDSFLGTYDGGSASNKIDYILLSPALYQRVTGGGVFRKGVWAGVRSKRWDMFGTIKEESQAASDHAAIWADLAL